jgi:hypothetical protein
MNSRVKIIYVDVVSNVDTMVEGLTNENVDLF